jgi:hypothetical protein
MRTKNEILQGEDEKEFMLKCFFDLELWCTRVLGFTLKPFHKEWLGLLKTQDRIAISAPTGFGKTTIFGIAYPLWLLYFKPQAQVLIISKTIRTQSASVLGDLKRTIEDNEILKSLIPISKNIYWTKERINTSNGGKLFYSSYSVNVRGVAVDYVFGDEVAVYPETGTYFENVVTRVAAKKGKIACASTPFNTTDLLAQLQANPMYFSKSYPAIINYTKGDYSTGESIWPEKFPISYLMDLKKEIGIGKFEKNYMVNPRAESEDPIFSIKSIAACFDYDAAFNAKIAPEGQVFMGCDFAVASGPTADFDAFVIVEKDTKVSIKHGETHKGLPVQEKIRRIEQLNELHKPQLIVIDESLIGKAVIEDLRMKGLPVESQNFNSKARNSLLMNLKRLIDNNNLIIPKNKEDMMTTTFVTRLEEELLGFREVKSLTTGAKNCVSTTKHDDTVMALAMACKRVPIHREFVDFIGVG